MTIIMLFIFCIYLLFAFKFHFVPFSKIKKLCNKKQGFKSLMVLLGSSMGVGNIVGVGVAIYLAGPGVLFWMLISAFVSATTNYLEVYYSKKSKVNNYAPISYIDNRKVSVFYTILMIITSLFIGNMTQVNSIKIALEQIKPEIIILILILLFVICTYKYENISKTLTFIMPFATLIYLILGCYLLVVQKDNLLPAIKNILNCALMPQSTLGIPFYYVFNQGVLFAIFSNEAGNGSGAMAFKDNQGEAEDLGVVASLGPIIDTALICVLTGLIILTNQKFANFQYQLYNPDNKIYIVEIYSDSFGLFGQTIMVMMIILFAVATLISWFYYARIGIKYLKVNYSLFYFVYLLIMAISFYLKLTFLMNLANYFNLSLLIINLMYLLKKVYVVK